MVLVAMEEYITSLCVKESRVFTTTVPCPARLELLNAAKESAAGGYGGGEEAKYARRLQASVYEEECADGYQHFIQPAALHDVHYLIFMNGIMHVFSTLVVMIIAFKIVNSRKMRSWETLAQSSKPDFDHKPGERQKRAGRRLDRMMTLDAIDRTIAGGKGRLHTLVRFIVAIPGHINTPLTLEEYKVIRAIFIENHFNKELYSTFSFHNFIYLSLQNDFSKLMTLSLPMWLLVLFRVYMSSVDEAYLFYWFPFLGVGVGVLTGAKLSTMCQELSEGKITWDKINKTFSVENRTERDRTFFLNSIHVLGHCIRFVIFHGSTMIALVAFFWYQTIKDSMMCWNHMMGEDGWVAWMIFGTVILQLVHCGLILIPLYSLVRASDSAEDPKMQKLRDAYILDSMGNRDKVEAITKIWALKTKLAGPKKEAPRPGAPARLRASLAEQGNGTEGEIEMAGGRPSRGPSVASSLMMAMDDEGEAGQSPGGVRFKNPIFEDHV